MHSKVSDVKHQEASFQPFNIHLKRRHISSMKT